MFGSPPRSESTSESSPCGAGALLMQVRMPPEMGRNEPQEPLQSAVCAADSFVMVEISLPKVKLKV